MGVIFRMALRNLREHKRKTTIIGLFIAFGVCIIELGNGFIEATTRGMERDFRANYTGDVMISAPIPEGCQMDLFGISSLQTITEVPSIPAMMDREKVEKILSETKGIKKQTKVISSKALLMNNDYADFQIEDQNMMNAPVFFLFAGENETYFDMFPGQKLTEGRRPTPGTNEILVDERLKTKYKDFFKEDLELNKTYLVAGASAGNILREGVISGFFRQENEDTCMFTIVYADPSFTRSFAELTYASSFAEELPDEIDTSLSAFSEDDLFGDDFLGVEDEIDLTSTGTDFDAILGDTTLRDKLNETDDGAWHFILLKLDNPAKTDEFVSMLEARFQAEGLQARACNWKEASGTFTSSVEGINILFVALVVILAVVVFIIIMNTMLISILERTGEIGTMRALGSDKKFVRKLFLTESLSITLFSAAAGSVLALILMAVFNAAGIKVTNDIAKMILGGGAVNLIPTFGSFFRTIIIVTLGSVMACFYPVSMALKITPLKALSQGDK